jgi:hypothetical protein
VYLVRSRVAEVEAALAQAIRKAGPCATVVHAPGWVPEPAWGRVDGVHTLTDEGLLAALAAATAQTNGEVLEFRGDALAAAPAGGEPYMQALAAWGAETGVLEIESKATALSFQQALAESEAPVWVVLREEHALEHHDRPGAWQHNLVLDSDGRLGVATCVLTADERPAASVTPDSRVRARYGVPTLRPPACWVPSGPTETLPVARVRRVRARSIPLRAASAWPAGSVPGLGVRVLVSLEEDGWDGASLRAAARLCAGPVKVLGARAEDATSAGASIPDASALDLEACCMLPALLLGHLA